MPKEALVQSVVRATRLLARVSLVPQGLSDIARPEGIALPTATRLLRTLAALGYVTQTAEGGYIVGPELMRITYTLERGGGGGALIRRAVEDLRDRVDETVGFFTVSGLETICVETAESNRPVRRVYHVGMRNPIWVGASGRVLLAFGDTETFLAAVHREWGETLTLPSGKTRPYQEFVEGVERARKAGCAISSQEMSTESWGVSAPIFAGANLIGALGVGAPTTRSDPGYVEQLRQACCDAAHELTLKLDPLGGALSGSRTGPLGAKIGNGANPIF